MGNRRKYICRSIKLSRTQKNFFFLFNTPSHSKKYMGENNND